MDVELLKIIKELKESLTDEGFIIEGIFGSYARGENKQGSDIDILYELNAEFRNNYRGFKAIAKLDEIQEKISQSLKLEVDLIRKSSLTELSSKYILPEVVYV